MLHEFTTLPPRPRPANVGALLSFAVHAAILVPYLVHAASPDRDREDPIDQLVVFLVPPDREGGRHVAGPGIQWSGLQGTDGAVKEPLPKDAHPEETLELGTRGTPEPDTAQAVGTPEIEEALSEIEVDSMVARDPSSAAPIYPPGMLAKNLEGSTFVHYVVDTSGRVDTLTIKVVRSTHEEFAKSVRMALALMKFRPAVQGSRRVRQWVEQNFSFRIVTPKPPAADTT